MRTFCILGILILSAKCYGQIKIENFHFSVGPIAYSGDLSHNYDIWSPVIEAGVDLFTSRKIERGVNLMVGSFSGNSNRGIQNQNYFKSLLISLHHHFGYSGSYKMFTLKFESGPGFLYFNPKDEFGESLASLAVGKNEDETYRNLSLSLDTKLSLFYKLNDRIGFKIGGGFVLPFSDYLDNISKTANEVNKDNLLRFNFGLITAAL